MTDVFEPILQVIGLLIATGAIIAILYYLLRLATGFLLIGLIAGFLFMEVYGIYLFFTEKELYTEDLAVNGILSFTGFYITLNLGIILFGLWKFIRYRTYSS